MKKHIDFIKMLCELVFIFLVALLLGLFPKYNTIEDKPEKESVKCERIEYDVENASDEMIRVYLEILNKFYDDVDPEELRNAAINGMLNSLDDPNSIYMNNEEANSFLEKMRGEYKGVGLEIYNSERGVTVLTVFDNSPAAEAGLKVDDVIKTVDGESVEDMSATQVSQIIKYGESDDVVLEILRGDEVLTYNFTKAIIVLRSVEYKVIEVEKKKIGYIELTVFASNSYEQFKDALTQLESEKIDGLIIDIRNNTGGYLHVVTDLLEMFLKEGDILYQIKDKDGISEIKDTTKESKKYPISVLVNNVSASASEILAAGLKESYGATIIGINTFGKGTVQETITFSNGTLAKITTKEWLTPKGNQINNVGIDIDYEEILTGNYYDDSDNQINRALEILTGPNKK